MVIGKMIRNARIDARKTQKQLANRLDCSQQYVSRLENGIRTPSIDTLRKIAIALNKKLIDPKIR